MFAANANSQPFTVQGSASVTQKPDSATISFTVSKTAAALSDAQNQANTFTNTIVADVKKIGIGEKDIKTSNYNSSPDYTMPMRGGQTITGYTVSESVTITLTNITKANSVIDTITKDGAENISGPNLAFLQSTQDALTQKARLQAIADAKNKAQALASAAGIRLGRVINIQENSVPFPIRPMMLKTDGPTQVNPGENTITETVTLSYETW